MYYDQRSSGLRIAQLRHDYKLSQTEMADKFNISVEHYRSVELGRRGASIDLLIELSIFFDVSLDYLILGRTQHTELMKQNIDEIIQDLVELRGLL